MDDRCNALEERLLIDLIDREAVGIAGDDR